MYDSKIRIRILEESQGIQRWSGIPLGPTQEGLRKPPSKEREAEPLCKSTGITVEGTPTPKTNPGLLYGFYF